MGKRGSGGPTGKSLVRRPGNGHPAPRCPRIRLVGCCGFGASGSCVVNRRGIACGSEARCVDSHGQFRDAVRRAGPLTRPQISNCHCGQIPGAMGDGRSQFTRRPCAAAAAALVLQPPPSPGRGHRANVPPSPPRPTVARVLLPTPVHVEAVIERPPPLPWVVAELPFPERVDYWPGTLLAARWLDKAAGVWTGLVRYERDGLLYEHWLPGDLITPTDEAAAPTPKG